MTNKERIEAYFDNSLSTTERESLLRDIESDPSLKSEFEFQNEVVEGVQAYRKEELIARLNNVQVASVGSSTMYKILGTLGIAAVISSGLFWYYSSDNNIQEPVDTVEITKSEPVEQDNPGYTNTDETIAIEEEKEEPVVELNEEQSIIEKNPVVEEQAKETVPAIVIPDVVEPDSEGIAALEENHDAPESMKTESVSVSSSADIEIKLDKKYDFHYQVVAGDLTLYGEFDDSKFEVIELKTNLGIKLYLYYNKFYYELKNDSEEIRPLKPVEEKAIVQELDKRRQ